MPPATRSFRWVFAALLLAPGAVSAQVTAPAPVREYLFAGNFSDTLGGPDLQPQGGSVVDGSYFFGPGQGLLLADLSLATSTYTLELALTYAATGGYRKIVDFLNRASDTGFYVLGNSLNFYPVADSGLTEVVAGQPVHVVLTRDAATSVISAYVNGLLSLSFTDSGGLGVINGPNRELYFFVDDLATGGGEAGAGSVDFIRLYNQSLDSAQVLSLFQNGPAAVPEPSVAALLALGAGLLLLRRRRRAVAAGRD
ncbi:MAG: PEP-CTERM sorting domain-containing protein [Opitutae bacterium]|nr:PEP-CTERM sorting domain-containing protein [Opitutae bacterium]